MACGATGRAAGGGWASGQEVIGNAGVDGHLRQRLGRAVLLVTHKVLEVALHDGRASPGIGQG